MNLLLQIIYSLLNFFDLLEGLPDIVALRTEASEELLQLGAIFEDLVLEVRYTFFLKLMILFYVFDYYLVVLLRLLHI